MPQGGGGTGVSRGSAAILVWLQRNSAVDQANGAYAPEAWRSYLVRQTGLSDRTRDMERVWLRSRVVALGGSVGDDVTINDLWDRYLTIKGFTGNVDDKFAQWIDHGSA